VSLSGVLTSVFLVSIWIAVSFRIREAERRRPLLTIATCLLLTGCLLAQLRHPHLLIAFERDQRQVWNGEWWRIFTAVFFQDGWILGGLTNIVWLAAIGNLCEQVWSRPEWLMVGLLGALTGELFGLSWEPVGAGNSIVTCALAGSLLLRHREPSIAFHLLRILALIACVILTVRRDIHGVAAISGIIVGFVRRTAVGARPTKEHN